MRPCRRAPRISPSMQHTPALVDELSVGCYQVGCCKASSCLLRLGRLTSDTIMTTGTTPPPQVMRLSRWRFNPETVHFWGPERATFKLGTIKIVNVLFRFFRFLGKQVFKGHRPKYSEMLCFLVFGNQDP